MDNLWAPWRLKYIKHIKKEKGCIFCRAYQSKKNRENFVFLKTKYSLAMLNLYPYNNGHIMVAPKKHTKSLDILSEDERTDLFNCLITAQKLLDKTLKPQGYNMGANLGRVAGAGVDKHLHIHLVPRWNGDTNFMPLVFQTKVISQSLQALYNELTKNIKN